MVKRMKLARADTRSLLSLATFLLCRLSIHAILREYGYPLDLEEEATKTVLAQAELLCADWTA